MSLLTIPLLIFATSFCHYCEFATDIPRIFPTESLPSEEIQIEGFPNIFYYLFASSPVIYCLYAFINVLSAKSPTKIIRLHYFITCEMFQLVPTFSQMFNLIFIVQRKPNLMFDLLFSSYDRPLSSGFAPKLAFAFVFIRFILLLYSHRQNFDPKVNRTRFSIDVSLMVLIELIVLPYANRFFLRILRKIFLVALLYQLNEVYGNQRFWTKCDEILLRRCGRSDENPQEREKELLNFISRIRWIFIKTIVVLQGLPILFRSLITFDPRCSILMNFYPLLVLGFVLLLLKFDATRFFKESESKSFDVICSGVASIGETRRTDRHLVSTSLKNRFEPDIVVPNLNQRTCKSCFDNKSLDEFQLIGINDCEHEIRNVCSSCLFQNVKITFESTDTDDIFCPEPSCNVKLSYDTVKTLFQSRGYEFLAERYDRYVAHRAIENMPEFIWCSNPLCHAGQLNEGGELNNMVTCYKCNEKTCFTHKVKWHEGMTCDEFTHSLDTNERFSRKWITENCQKCPNCPYEIEKNEGCDHMTCIKCRHEFCWSCLADFQPIRQHGNRMHRSTCKHYAVLRA